MPFYTQEVSSSTSFHTARRSTPDNGSRTSLVINMVDPFIRLRPKSTRKSQEDEWYIPYSKPPPPSSYIGIGASPHAPPQKQSSLMSYLHAPLTPANAQADGVRTYRFPTTLPVRSFPQRPLPTGLQPPDSVPSPSVSGMRVPTTSSVPTGLTAPKLLFSPLAREARQPLPEPPGKPISAEVRARTISAPARTRRQANEDSKRWITPTVCDRFVFPRPAITPLFITPPSSPERVTDDRSSFLSKEEWRVMDEGKKRLQEREDWADYVQRRGRSMSFGDQRGKPGGPIIGNARMRTKEHERRLSRDSGRSGRRNSLSSLWRRSTERNTLHPSTSDDNVGLFNSFGFPRRMSTSRAAPSQPDDPLVTPRAAGEDFFPSRYPSHRYGGIRGLRGHTHTRSSPDLSQVSREASLRDAPPLPPGPPPRTLRIQPPRRSSYRGQEEGVIVIGPGNSAYRAPPPEPRRPTDLDAFTSARSPHPSEPTFRSRAPRPLDLTVTVSNGYTSAPSTGVRSSQRSSGANVNKALPDVPRADNSPTLELAPFSDLTAEVGKAMSPEMRSISGMATIRGVPRPPRRDQAYDSTLMYFNTAATPFRKSDGSSVGTSPFRKSDASGATRDSTLSPARALLVKQHQLAKTKRAFQSPANRQPSYRATKSAQPQAETPLWRQDSVATPSSAPHSNASFSSTRPLVSQPSSVSSATAMPPTAYKRKPTALEEAIGRSRAASLSTLEQQDPLAKSSSNRTLHRAGAGSDGAHAAPYALDSTAADTIFAAGPSSTPRVLPSDKSPVLGPPITSSPAIVTPTPARNTDAPFLPLPPNPPNMLRTDTSTTTQSKTTAYSSASEGWDRGIDSGAATPSAGVLPGRSTPGQLPAGDYMEQLDQGTPQNPPWAEERTPQNLREDSPDDSPDNHMDERDFAGLFFRTPKDLDAFSSPGTLNAASPGTLGGASRDSSGLQPAHELARENNGLGIDMPSDAPTDALAVHPLAEMRRPSDASNNTNRTNGTGGTAQTGGTGGTGGSGHTQITTPILGEQADVAGSSSQESHSGPSVESATRMDDRNATLRGRPKPPLGDLDSLVPLMFPAPPAPIPPLSAENPEAGNRRVSPEPTQSSTPVTATPTSSTRNLPGTRSQPFSPGTFGHPTPKREREDYFGHRSNPSAGSQSAISTKSTRSATSGLSGQSVPVRPPRPPSPGLEAFRQSTGSGPIITFARTGDTISPIHSPQRSARSPSSESFDRGRFSAVPSFVSDFPSPPLPNSPTITQFSQAAPPSSVSTSTLTPSGHTGSSETIHPTDFSAAPPVPPVPPLPTASEPAAQVDEFGSLPASPNIPGSPPRQVMSGAISSPSSPSRKARRHGMAFGQVVSGSPGAGKSTYAHGMYQFLSALHRPCHIINLDPATPNPTYPCAINVTDLVSLEDVMREHGLGPNGAMLYCAEYLEANMDWLIERLDELLGDTPGTENTVEEEKESRPGYVIFDTPGQVELWTNHDSFKRIIESLTKLDYRLVSVHLSDAQYIADASTFISVALLALRANMQLELPHINVLSKIDRLATYGELPFDVRYYTECRDLHYLLSSLESDSRQIRMTGLNRAMVELIEQYGAVSFETLAVEDKRSMLKLLRVLDNAIGYIPLRSTRTLEPGQQQDLDDAQVGEAELLDSMPTLEELGDVDDVQERWGWRKEEADREEEEAWEREWTMRNARESGNNTALTPGLEAQGDEENEDEVMFRGADRALPLSGMAAQVLRP